jgi:hypothetical protein
MRCRHRVSKQLLRYGRVYPREASTWTQAHRRWLAQQRFAEPNAELADLDALCAVDGLMARREALEQRLSQIAHDAQLWPLVARLRRFRGIDTLTALALCCEIGDFTRFARAEQLSAWLGLVPSLQQSGQTRRAGSITKTGSRHARRLLVEAAWHYTRPPRIGVTLTPTARPARRNPPTRLARTAPPPPHAHPTTRARQAAHRRHHRRRPRTGRLPLGRHHHELTPGSPSVEGTGCASSSADGDASLTIGKHTEDGCDRSAP